MRTPLPPRMTGAVSVCVRGRRLTFRCDAAAGCVRITDAAGRRVGRLGGPGPGALSAPLDIVAIEPPPSGPRLLWSAPGALWLAVADYGHRRIQLFDTDGAHIAAVDLGDEPGLGAPCALSWQPPVLEVEGLDGGRVRLYPGAALLALGDTRWQSHVVAPGAAAPREAVH